MSNLIESSYPLACPSSVRLLVEFPATEAMPGIALAVPAFGSIKAVAWVSMRAELMTESGTGI